MPDVVVRHCPHCGAALPAAGEATVLRCEFCGRESDLRKPAQAPPPPGPRATGAVPRGNRSRATLVPAVMAAILLMGAAVAAGVSAESCGKESITVLTTAGLHDVTGDGIEDAIVLAFAAADDNELHLMAFEGTSFEELWRAGPYGSTSEAGRAKAALVGTRILRADQHGRGHLHDPATGEETGTVALPDLAAALCSNPDAASVWVQADNGRHAVIDTVSGLAQPADAPPWGDDCDAWDLGAPEIEQPNRNFPAPGVRIFGLLGAGDLAIAFGRRDSGVRVPRVFGLQADRWTPTWDATPLTVEETAFRFAEAYALAGDRVYVAYTVAGGAARFGVLDARTGARISEVEVPSCSDRNALEVERIRVGHTRILLEGSNDFVLLDARTHAVIGCSTPYL